MKAFNCTLLLLLYIPFKNKECLVAAHIGDGCIATIDHHQNVTLLSNADHGAHSGETLFLCSIPENHIMLENFGLKKNIVKFSFKENLSAIALMSDGVSDDFFPEQEMLKNLFYGNPILEMTSFQGNQPQYGLLTQESGIDQMSILDAALSQKLKLSNWLDYDKKQSFDDKTIIILKNNQNQN
jgi:hypothetical protein